MPPATLEGARPRARTPESAPHPPRAAPAPLTRRPGYWPLAGGFALTALGVGILLSNLMPLFAALDVPDGLAILAASTIGPAQVAGRVLLILAGARIAAQRVVIGAFAMLATAACLMGAAAALPALALAFAVAQGVGNGVISILRPVVTREVMGDEGFGESAGAVARLSLFAFALAPALGAVLADLFGYGAVIGLCIAAPLAGAVLLGRLGPAE